jgi:hypothetical protein
MGRYSNLFCRSNSRVKEATSWRANLPTGGAVDLPMLRGAEAVVNCARSKASRSETKPAIRALPLSLLNYAIS